MAESLCLCHDPAFVPAPGAALCPVESEVIWGSQWGLPQEEFLTPQALRSRWGCRWSEMGPLQSGVHHPFPSWPSWGAPPDDQMLIAASEGSLSLWGWLPGCVAPFGCGSVVRARPRDDGYAFPGRRECRARVESSTASRSFEAGWVVSCWGSRWFSAPTLRCHSSRKYMRSSQDRGRHLSLPETNLVAPPPHQPRWWSHFGVRGHPLGGAVCGHATVSNSSYHSAGWSVSPLTGL